MPTGDIGMKGAANYVVGGVLALRRLETAVTSCAGANGFGMTMLFGTPYAGQSRSWAET